MNFEIFYLIVYEWTSFGNPEKKSSKIFSGRTVCTDEERYEALRHCRYVDIILPSAPWGYSEEFFDEHKIDFIAHDDEPYTIGGGGVSGKFSSLRNIMFSFVCF